MFGPDLVDYVYRLYTEIACFGPDVVEKLVD